ncbi:MAG: hypothetical protein KME28_16745 [Pelatocladus maniniholoensis HA4357-MV3]|uniref:Uncharacterized protein n=1 Tax=Pelatocladus maniniholoensis HA4357-MV3 TaxID=1117104 RepID=A0A9E3LU65_9NOST|nr:hypothetical protein [Pelatocladus maniniholoensis HA4357-MV3]
MTLSGLKATEILGSTSPLKLDALRYLTQRWFSPQALTFRLPNGSCISTKFVFTCLQLKQKADRLVPLKILPIPGWKLKLRNRTPYLQLSRYSVCLLGSNRVFNVVDYPTTLMRLPLAPSRVQVVFIPCLKAKGFQPTFL